VRKRIAALTKDRSPPLVATLGKEVVGLCVFGRIATLHRPRPTGHVTLLAVTEQARRRGIGRMLVEAAEARLATLGCGRVEIAVGDARLDAQAFYRSIGYERTSIRFAKAL
jgi:ribosomal protein S18 acetylase RimI-like enzyme